MRFARLNTPHDRHHRTLDRLLQTADLDVLQLDYTWPRGVPVEGQCAEGFLGQLRLLHKAMYLDPQLHVVTNAGGGNPRDCVETVAEFLCDHGSAELPLTLIRGNNLLPRLSEMRAAGIAMSDLVADNSGKELKQPLLVAQVDLGAGPIATALNEGSRMVIAGCYDSTAPAIATAVSALGWNWGQVEALAPLAVATHLPDVVLEIEQKSSLTIHAATDELPNAEQLRRMLLQRADADGIFSLADVRCEIQDFKLRQQSRGVYRIAGITGLGVSEAWQFRVIGSDNAQLVCTIPREKVAVSVDTRPAKEWR